MIKEITMYTVICDNCGVDVNEGEEYSCWNFKPFAEDCAIEANWVKEENMFYDKHYCLKCYSYNDNDELVIDESRKKIS